MIAIRATYRSITCAIVVIAIAKNARAQHLDVQVQSVDGRLTTGAADFENGGFTLGLRVWTRFFNSEYAVNNPGFNAGGTNTGVIPPGSAALPGGAALWWDFLPMKLGGTTSNLLYWNASGGSPGSVQFGPAPGPDYSLSLFGENDVRSAADGSAALVAGGIIDTTAVDGFIHAHRYFFLDNDHDDNNDTVAAPGVYLVAMRLRMEELDRSDPFYILWGTPGAATNTLSAAAEWVGNYADQLAPNFAADFDGDLDVDGADLIAWQGGLGTTGGSRQGHGDANGDRSVNAADLSVWQSEFGASLETFMGAPSTAVGLPAPEPGGLLLLGLAMLGSISPLRPRRRRRISPLEAAKPL
jgi:hypothetical protein